MEISEEEFKKLTKDIILMAIERLPNEGPIDVAGLIVTAGFLLEKITGIGEGRVLSNLINDLYDDEEEENE